MQPILFQSTNGQAPAVDLRHALLEGQAPDRGLYLPLDIPSLAPDTLAEFPHLPYPQIAARVLAPFTRAILDPTVVAALCDDAYNYDVPVEPARSDAWILRLDRGPTASFKDFAARIMARWIGRFIREQRSQLTILTATSGDTGAAVAAAFHRVDGTRIVVLFPRDEVSDRQRRQMTTLGDNTRAIAIDGKFDDCQALVKRAFADPTLAPIRLSSANSINIGRLLPQTVYYFYAASRIAPDGAPVVFSVPSGNFGNMMGAAIAKRMGLAIHRLLVPVNENDEFPRFLASGNYRKVEPSRDCLSNAMNVGHPSNLARLVALYDGHMDETGQIHRQPDLAAMRRDLASSSVSDARTRETIRHAWDAHRILLEPHGAVAWRGYLDALEGDPTLDRYPAAILETAHPAKFPDEIRAVLGFDPQPPAALAGLDDLPEDYDSLPADYDAFRAYLLARHAP